MNTNSCNSKEEYLRFSLHPENFSPLISKKLAVFRSNLTQAKVLDMGCGIGYATRYLTKEGFEVVALDIDEISIMQCKFVSNLLGIEHPLVTASITNIPLKNEVFDSIICSEVLEHIPDVRQALSELNRVLKKGGRLVITVPGYAYLVDKLLDVLGLKSKYTNFALKMEKELGMRSDETNSSVQRAHGHLHKFTPKFVSNLLENTGFRVIAFKNLYFLSQFISAFFLGFLGKKPSYITGLVTADLRIAKHVPLIIGGGWLVMCDKKV